MHGGTTIVAGAVAVCIAACSGSHPAHRPSAPETRGHLQLRLGPGAPPENGSPSTIRLRVTGPSEVTVDVHLGQQVSLLLPEGVYSVKSSDGGACATGISVDAGATVRDDLAYPLKGCQYLGG